MSVQTLVPPVEPKKYRIFQSPCEVEEIIRATDIFESSMPPRIIIQTEEISNGKPFYDFYEWEPVLVKSDPYGKMVVTLESAFKSINIIPELVLGLITLLIGLVGAINALITNQVIVAFSMSGFLIAGIITLVGSKILKRRLESSNR